MRRTAPSRRRPGCCSRSPTLRGQAAARAATGFTNDHLDGFLNAASDAGDEPVELIWAAEPIGLGTFPISVMRNDMDTNRAEIELPDHVFRFAGMCVGWPVEDRHVAPRLPLKAARKTMPTPRS